MVARAEDPLDQDYRHRASVTKPSRSAAPPTPAPKSQHRRFQSAKQQPIAVERERDCARVRCAGALDARIAAQLRDECEGLLTRGFACVVLDLGQIASIGPAGVTAIATIEQRARMLGARLSVVPPTGAAAASLRRAGLLGHLQLEGADDMFWDWSR